LYACSRPRLFGWAWGVTLFAPTLLFCALFVGAEFWPALNAPGTGKLLDVIPLTCLVACLAMVAVSDGTALQRFAVALLSAVVMAAQYIADVAVLGCVSIWWHGLDGGMF
jgi:hypothetical protein